MVIAFNGGVMFSLNRYTKSLLLIFLCAGAHILTIHAGWFTNWFKHWTYNFTAIYPFNMTYMSIKRAKKLSKVYAITIDNTEVQKTYPRACIYVQNELKKVGIDPTDIKLMNTDDAKASVAWPTILIISLAQLEPALEKQEKNETLDSNEQKQFNQARVIIAHEIGHLQQHSSVIKTLAPMIALPTTYVITRCGPLMHKYPLAMTIPLIIATTACSQTLVNTIAHIDEYRADGAAIKRFKNQPQTLIDLAELLLTIHQNLVTKLRQVVFTDATKQTKQNFTKFWQNPLSITGYHWLTDTHESQIARANRLLKAAGIPSTQWLLCHELEQQFKEQQEMGLLKRLNHRFCRKEDIDMPRIIEACKKFAQKMDAIEIPEPLKTYGL